MNGAFRLVLSDSLKRLLNRLVQERFRNPRDRESRAGALRDLLAHPYLVYEPWTAAEERHSIERAKRCLQMLEGFRVRLERGEVRYMGIEDATGQPELTADRLKDHSLRLLDLSSEWLLLSVARHPAGGAGVIRRQYWLYRRREHVLYLLHAETVATVRDGQWKVQAEGEPWRDPDETLETDFYKTVTRILGPEASVIVKQSDVPADALAYPAPEVLKECQSICEVDYQVEETRRREERQKTYMKRYGPRQPGLFSISTRGLELVYADEEGTETG